MIEKSIEILERTPDTIRAMLGGLSSGWTTCNEGGESWSAYDIVGHLIHGEHTDWIERLEIILDRTDKNFQPFDRFAQFEESKGKTLQELLAEFERLRMNNIRYLKSRNIHDEQLDLTGIHPVFGTVTLRQLLSTWVAHDLNHLAQICRVMAHQYKQDVGPWKEFLPILQIK